ncbi:MAG: hypothetical protein K5659_07490 [Lachnospiraceae bacterium]|nr:hypothetical protein [Lachnospiraceae bacterium]
MGYMYDTVFFSGKKKRTVKAIEIYEIIKKGIKKKGQTREWVCEFDAENEIIYIFFNNESEDFSLSFVKNEFKTFCKLYYPIDDISGKEDSTIMAALLDVLYKARKKFNTIEIWDDYGLAESYWESKKYRFTFRELSDEELIRVKKMFSLGYTKHEELLKAIMAEDMDLDLESFEKYENLDISSGFMQGCVQNNLATYVYETSDYGNEGRVSDMLFEFTSDPNKYMFALWTFLDGVSWIFCDGTRWVHYDDRKYENDNSIKIYKHWHSVPNTAQIDLMYNDIFAPLYLAESDPLNRCILAYRYFLSVYDFCGFKYTGHRKYKLVIDEIIENYGEDIGTKYLKIEVAYRKYVFHAMPDVRKNNHDTIIKNALLKYGEKLVSDYVHTFIDKYYSNYRFNHEMEYLYQAQSIYLDESLLDNSQNT